VARTIAIFNRKEIVLNEEWELTDGRILSRDYVPLSLGENNKGGIWKFRDITDNRNIEKRLEDQRLFFDHILNSIPADIAVFDANHRYLFVNENAFKNEDLRKWMIGKTDEDYARYSNRPKSFVEKRFELYDRAAAEGKQVQYIEKLVSKDGKAGHHLRLIRPVFAENGSLEFIMGYGLEVTDLIAAQEELKTSIDTFSSAFNYSGIGMALIGLNGMWLDVNQVLCQLTGYTKEELLGITFHAITYPEDDEMDRDLINQLLSRKISTYTIEKRYVSKQDKIVLVSLTVSLVWNNDGTPKFFIAQVVDITEKKELENEIRKKNNELEATKISLINKISQMEELSHIIAHNLRGPAGNIKMFSEGLLAKRNEGADSENLLASAFTEEQFLEFIEESSTALISSLSTLMKITEIKLNKEIAYDECNIAEMIRTITNQLNGIIFEKKARITSDLEIKWVHYPKVYLENILYNLISNALKYSRPGKVPEIQISAKVQNGRIRIVVKDNGLGIDLKKHGDKVFKLNQVFHAGYDSKGVGLYLTKTQVESLGGSIEVSSKPNEGCEFIVTF
jgi:PAS domain S-box-containing protein